MEVACEEDWYKGCSGEGECDEAASGECEEVGVGAEEAADIVADVED